MGALTFCGCEENANSIIEIYFHDCTYSTKDVVGFLFGMTSIAFWLLCQIPQFVSNIRTQKVEALSAWFLAEWLLGDTCNLTGCILTGQQLPTETYTAMYFVLADIVLLMQYTYYTALHHRQKHLKEAQQQYEEHRRKRHRSVNRSRQGDGGQQPLLMGEEGEVEGGNNGVKLLGTCLLTVGGFLGFYETPWQQQQSGQIQFSRKLLEHPPDLKCYQNPPWARMLGQGIGYCSSVFYLTGRVSQILKNCRKKQTDGLAVTMFLYAILANVTYALGIILRVKSKQEFIQTLPWLIGSLGTVGLDVYIFIQGVMYKKGPKQKLVLENENIDNDITLPLTLHSNITI